ncbi:hypothetical protein HL667_05485 [Bradyrhizobium sp. 83012]|uniref:Uncharacterized protein n=1 Tax=Bradyrhizobium aeschynomenes TaxID=2734909 RepID=A0ABX2C848_9BRAD|nr:hypothetical protein [Bradyrhizobium aeschynomenes]NPU14618.1 hypothetical protein [Bradyrhizobium aeschynomenes]NPU64444.1 hypothetical protein [Bradyrhizobium aeschynomenes]NPV21505.1 hypothetical protein [Bradyrhizobium aeschynomenes]
MAIKRNRSKQIIPFAERLQQAAAAARDAAELLPAGQERDILLKKALQAETAAHINELLSAPIMQAADR